MKIVVYKTTHLQKNVIIGAKEEGDGVSLSAREIDDAMQS